MDKIKAFDDDKELSGATDKKDKEIQELKTVLQAWHDVFGTTQLSHASDRLQTAEDSVKRLASEKERLLERLSVEKIREMIWNHSTWFDGASCELKIKGLARAIHELIKGDGK